MLGKSSETFHRESFKLPEHANSSSKSIVEDLANFFSNISNNYEPLKVENLPEYVQNILNSTDDNIPKLQLTIRYNRSEKG